MNPFMKAAVEEAYEGIKQGHGGPFGAVIVKDGKIIGKGHNMVVKELDPTMHGEIVAIKEACLHENHYDLSGAELYTTAEPCPMCLGAILWAGITTVYYGCDRLDTDKIGFRDDVFYKMIDGKRSYDLQRVDHEECKGLFKAYQAIENRVIY
ncbi:MULTISPECIES: nucleoside deaminase [Bacillaceae]|uniref:nucleoside deaminase n=1 Tax=Bacillaceae TaxID=186817 RepID=UPI00080ADD5E|nr:MULTISPECIES: nucleoside deaminase [Bacillaceae]OCA82559.1 tRNA-specific adenosine deaminase [Bacillus sp. FJAT-27986]